MIKPSSLQHSYTGRENGVWITAIIRSQRYILHGPPQHITRQTEKLVRTFKHSAKVVCKLQCNFVLLLSHRIIVINDLSVIINYYLHLNIAQDHGNNGTVS